MTGFDEEHIMMHPIIPHIAYKLYPGTVSCHFFATTCPPDAKQRSLWCAGAALYAILVRMSNHETLLAQEFIETIDTLFDNSDKGQRHIPGAGLREWELHLAPPPEEVIPGVTAELTRIIRPNPGDTTPLKPRPTGMLEGHRLHTRQTFEEAGLGINLSSLVFIKNDILWLSRTRYGTDPHAEVNTVRSIDDNGIIEHMRFRSPRGDSYSERSQQLSIEEGSLIIDYLLHAQVVDAPERWMY